MKNKVVFKKYIFICILTIVIFTFLAFIINKKEYNLYKKEVNQKIGTILEKIDKKYDISKDELLDILNSKDSYNNFLREYGYDFEKDAFLENMNTISFRYISLETIILIILSFILVLIFKHYNKRNSDEIADIISLLESINRGEYHIDMGIYAEDELSILTDEIYKTTLKLNEYAENSLKDKINLKNSLSDITHQIKTPLTSILIMLENIEDDKDMDENVKAEFLKRIKRELLKIHFLAKNILKISEFDANSISFNNREISIQELIDRTIENTSTLSDLKNIKIKLQNNCKKTINCDFEWQVEALTNILKNAIEHSEENKEVFISAKENDLFINIEIKDYGTGISEKDINHIFDRFYKCKDSSKDSNGIGLSLAKSIITASNGNISVKSEKDKGTIFSIKYFLK